MINLFSNSSLIQLVTSAAGSIDTHVSYVDYVASPESATPATENHLAIATATTTTILGSPASGQRNAKLISIRNTHATVSNTVTVKHNDGTVAVELQKVTLGPGETLVMNDAGTWFVYDATGGVRVGAGVGRFVKTTTVSTGTTFTTGPTTNSIFVRAQGGGAGGGGCTSVAAAASAGGGGGGGSYAEKWFIVNPNTAYTIAIGAGGAGVSAAAGANGGNTTIAVGATMVTAPGGSGAPVATAVTTPQIYRGGAGGAISTNGDLNDGGMPGDMGVIVNITGPVGVSGNGGSSNFGSGGLSITAVGNGANAIGFGAGGSGAMTGASVARTGGNGTGGCLVIDEYT